MISKTLSVSPARKFTSDPGFPHISSREMCHARPSPLTVFSITQSDHSIALLRLHDNADLEMLPEKIEEVDFEQSEKYNG
jgi:hypothetical protein